MKGSKMMDIKKKIRKILEQNFGEIACSSGIVHYRLTHRVIDEFVGQIADLFEPVTLEELTDEERYTVNIPCETCPSTCNFLLHPSAACMDCVVKCHAKATIAKNSKTQLYRIKGDL
jgi:hypothetical protein